MKVKVLFHESRAKTLTLVSQHFEVVSRIWAVAAQETFVKKYQVESLALLEDSIVHHVFKIRSPPLWRAS